MPPSRAAAAELLSEVPLFSHCSKRDLATVAKLANEVGLPAGHTLMTEGARVAYSFFILTEGAAEVRSGRKVIARLGPGDFFGELALLRRRPRSATVTLTEPSRLLAFSAHNFKLLLMQSPEIQFKLLEALADRLATATLG